MGILDRNKAPESGLSKTSSSSTQMQSGSVASGPKQQQQQQHLKANGNKKGTYSFLNNFQCLGKSDDVWDEGFHVLNLEELNSKLIKLYFNFKVRNQGAS